MRFLVICLSVVWMSACGDGGGDGNDAPDASTIDAGPTVRLNAVIDDVDLCPGGFTMGPTATDEQDANRITIVGTCEDGNEEVNLQYAPRPTGDGQTAPCTQSTFRSAAGATVICRVNNMVRNDPQGMLTMTGTRVDGECACEGDDGGTLRTGGVDFLLDLE